MKKSLFYILIFLLMFCLSFSGNAFSQQKGKRSIKVTVKDMADSFSEFYGNSYAVIIGINNYSAFPPLQYAVNDAQALEKRLKVMGFETTTLIDQDATRNNILEVLGNELPRKLKKNDRVVIFFAGHGHTEDLPGGKQAGYIIPVNADKDKIFATAISMDQVRQFSERITAKHVLYLMDSCYSGLALQRSISRRGTERDFLKKVTARKAHQILTAGGKGDQAGEEGGHGIFTKYLLDALDGEADKDGKGYVTFTDIAAYVKNHVARKQGAKQIPQYGNLEGEGEFVFMLASIRKHDTETVPPPIIPPSTFSIDDLEQKGKQVEASRAAWDRKLKEMKSAYNKVAEYEKRNVTPELKTSAWQRFLDSFQDKNPYTNEDESLRQTASQQINHWRQEKERLAAVEREQTAALMKLKKSPPISDRPSSAARIDDNPRPAKMKKVKTIKTPGHWSNDGWVPPEYEEKLVRE